MRPRKNSWPEELDKKETNILVKIRNMFFEQFKKIKVVVLDVDGVLTNGLVLVTEQGEQLRSFHVRDGYAIQQALKAGVPVVVISGGDSQGVLSRMQYLGVQHVFLGVKDKVTVLMQWLEEYGFQAGDVLFIGDDLPDLPLMKRVGLAACPSDAVEAVKTAAHYISNRRGGDGVVREVLEKTLTLQNRWTQAEIIPSI